jgi:hypothetical protein
MFLALAQLTLLALVQLARHRLKKVPKTPPHNSSFVN